MSAKTSVDVHRLANIGAFNSKASEQAHVDPETAPDPDIHDILATTFYGGRHGAAISRVIAARGPNA
ncbi:hypothetical protein [Sphingobium sp.]|uniref:hypothetical protein n=1 Tax=Sphingobium sp. TaxID=1912891 RepID=UPI002C957EE1|nr:hypothetical protein [Sphingobium sp.]HUD93611.1 hypothetical protein [Sphingobium sp.]